MTKRALPDDPLFDPVPVDRMGARAPDPAARATTAPGVPLPEDPRAGERLSAELEELRDILTRPVRTELRRIEKRIAYTGDDAVKMARLLPDAVRFRAAEDDQLAQALEPALATSIRNQARANPQIFVDAISPVLGESVRKAVADAMRGVVQALNRTLENSFSVKGLKWRFEALRTGRPYGEVVLAHTLIYRVEDVFLIHRETGLLLHHVHWDESTVSENADVITGMLSAITAFMEDSFHRPDTDALQGTIQHCADWIWVERGARMVIAARFQGEAPEALRTTLRQTLELLEMQLLAVLDPFEGDLDPFERSDPALKSCLDYQLASPSPRPSGTLLLLVLVLLGVTAWGATRLWQSRQFWDRALVHIDETPGIVVTEVGRDGLTRRLEGLRDPLAIPIAEALRDAGVNPTDVSVRFRPYLSLEDEMIMARARQSLAAPLNIDLSLEDGTLRAAGRANHAWISRASITGASIPGVVALDLSGVVDTDQESLAEKAGALSRQQLRFVSGDIRLASGQGEALAAIADGLRDLYDEARRLGTVFELLVVGHTDSTGSEDRNRALSLARAEAVRDALIRAGLNDVPLMVEGKGAREPLTAETSPESRERNRRVEFEVRLLGLGGREE